MLLRTKIFVSILLVSLSTLFICSYYLINRSHIDNVKREQERSLNEFTFIMSSLENGVDFQSSEDNLKLLFSRYAQYYLQRDVILMVYQDNTPIFSDFKDIDATKYHKLLSVTTGTRQVQILRNKDSHYFFVTGRPTDTRDIVLIYARDITTIYQLRSQSIYLSLLLAATLIILLSFLSYLYSRWLTKPIEKLNQGAISISEGDYSVRIPDTKDEFHSLGTAFNQMANDVEARTIELEEKAKELQVFIDDLSHEMNTPLTSIQGYSEFLLNAKASDDQKLKAAETIRLEAKRMKDIYSKLLTLSVIRGQEPVMIPVKIKDLLNDIKNTFHPLLLEQRISLTIENHIETLSLDHTLIQILISNLVKNSIQAVSVNGEIIIRTYFEDRNAIFEVVDDGCGIPEDKINQVMKPFFRVDKSRSRKQVVLDWAFPSASVLLSYIMQSYLSLLNKRKAPV